MKQPILVSSWIICINSCFTEYNSNDSLESQTQLFSIAQLKKCGLHSWTQHQLLACGRLSARGVVHKGLLPFPNKQHGIIFWGAWQSLVSFTDFLVCVYVIKPGDAEQQLIHCLGEPGLARHTEDVLSG